MIILLVCFSLSVDRDAIFGAVTLQFWMSSEVSFVFSLAKAKLFIMQEGHLSYMFAAVLTSGRGRAFLTLVCAIRALLLGFR